MGERNNSISGAFPEGDPEQDRADDDAMSRGSADRLVHMHFLDDMERVDRAIRGADDLEQMLKDVLDTILSIFDADRVFLLYPCDPDAESFSVPMESTRPEYPGAGELGFESISIPSLQALCRYLLDIAAPVSMGSGSDKPIPPDLYAQFTIKSILCMPIFPKVGVPWATGIHQCSREREWTTDERQLFQAIGRRVADSLSSFLTLRDLRRSEEQYRALFEWSADPTLLIDGDTFIACNDAAVRMLRYNNKEELLQTHPWELSPEFQPNGMSSQEKAEEILASMPHERSRRFEWTHRRADGELFPAEVLLTYIPVGDKHLINTVWRDLTELKKAEEMMIHSEKMLSVGGLAAGMAHEINNPLAGIMQSIQVVLDRLSPDMPANQKAAGKYGISLEALNDYLQAREITELLGGACASGRRAARIVDNMLSFSRKSSTEFAENNLAEIIDRTLELAANDYVAKRDSQFHNIQIKRCYDPDLPDVPCEETEIQQVVLNVLKNAAHAMVDRDEQHAQPCLTISIAPDSEMARIEIQDNGPGMSEAVRRRVFEPFYTTKSVGVGTGLGLSVSYFIIAEKHQGTLSVESRLGEGTKFIIRLPLQRKVIPMAKQQ